MGVENLSRRQFLAGSAAAGVSLSLDKIVLGHHGFLIPSEFLATLNALTMLQDNREKVPDDKSVKDAEQAVQKLFKEEYKSKKAEFADTLLGAAAGQKGATRYVVLRDAAQISSDNFKLSTAFKAIEQLAENYQLKLDSIVSDSLKGAKKGAKSPEQTVEFAEFGLKMADLSMKWNDYDVAVRAATEAKSVASRSTDKSLSERADGKLKEANLLKKDYDEYKKAELGLSSIKAEDTFNDASKKADWERFSLIIGKWYCFKEDKWNVGIYALRTGSDKELADIAKKEIDIKEKQDKGSQLTAENFYDVAEAWYSKSQKERDQREKGRYSNRALFWYDKTLESAEGLLKTKVEKKMTELRTAGNTGGNIVDLLRLIDPAKDAVLGKWETQGGKLKLGAEGAPNRRIEIPYQLPDEYDYRVNFTPQGYGNVHLVLSKGGKSFAWVMGGWENTIIGFHMIEQQPANMNPTTVKTTKCLEAGKTYNVLIEVRKDGVKAYVDGKQLAAHKTDYKDMSISPDMKLRDDNKLGIISWYPATFNTIEVVEVTGKGKFKR